MTELPAINWRNVAPSVRVERFVQQEASRLSLFYPGLRVRRVDFAGGVDSVHVSIELRAPERQVIFNYEHVAAYVAVGNAFRALFRKFERRAGGDRRDDAAGHGQLRAA